MPSPQSHPTRIGLVLSDHSLDQQLSTKPTKDLNDEVLRHPRLGTVGDQCCECPTATSVEDDLHAR
ncbi:hypothetical protein BH23ACT2_BH23ACT2_07140 [soil metagenome]